MLCDSECLSLQAGSIVKHLMMLNTCGDACRKLASSYPKLVHFEICVLANLAPGDVEEAKLMIPSIVVCLRSTAKDFCIYSKSFLLHRARCLKKILHRSWRKLQHTDDLCLLYMVLFVGLLHHTIYILVLVQYKCIYECFNTSTTYDANCCCSLHLAAFITCPDSCLVRHQILSLKYIVKVLKHSQQAHSTYSFRHNRAEQMK